MSRLSKEHQELQSIRDKIKKISENQYNFCADLATELLLAYTNLISKMMVDICKTFAVLTRSISHLISDPECSKYTDTFMSNKSCLFVKNNFIKYHLYKYEKVSKFKNYADKLDIYNIKEFILTKNITESEAPKCPFRLLTIKMYEELGKVNQKDQYETAALVNSYLEDCVNDVHSTIATANNPSAYNMPTYAQEDIPTLEHNIEV